jgi:DNA-binding beta-propeller fold protein YncE
MARIRTLQAILLAGLCTSVLLAACTPARQAAPGAALERIWPEPPAAPRIRYLRSFHNAEDLGIEKSFWQRLGEFISGPASSHLVRPMAVVTDASGELIYVADPGARGVHRFDVRRGKYKLLYRDNELPLHSPVGLALGPENRVYVTDAGLGQLFMVKPEDKYLSPVTLEAELEQPTGIVVEPDTGRLYIVDTAAHAIKVFSSTGAVIGQFGGRGSGAGEFNYPTALWRDRQGRLLVTDSLNFRIQFFTTEGRFLGQFGQLGDASGDMARPKGVATDAAGHVYVVDSMFHAFQVFDETGDLLLHLGEQGHAAGEFWLPTGLFIAADDRVYVADSHNQRVQIFRYIGGKP